MAHYSLERWPRFLATREVGRQVREDIDAALSRLSAGETLVIDFHTVEAATVSFTDECVAKLLMTRASSEQTQVSIFLSGVNQDLDETLAVVLARRRLAAVILDEGGEPRLVGEKDWLGETFTAARRLGSFRASDIATDLGLTPQAANNRLKALVATGAARRERIVPDGGGKEFVYTMAIPQHA